MTISSTPLYSRDLVPYLAQVHPARSCQPPEGEVRWGRARPCRDGCISRHGAAVQGLRRSETARSLGIVNTGSRPGLSRGRQYDQLSALTEWFQSGEVCDPQTLGEPECAVCHSCSLPAHLGCFLRPAAALLEWVATSCCVLALSQVRARHFPGLRGHAAPRGARSSGRSGSALCWGDSVSRLGLLPHWDFHHDQTIREESTVCPGQPTLGPSSWKSCGHAHVSVNCVTSLVCALRREGRRL